MRLLAVLVRIVGTLVLIYAAYEETGLWTGLCLLLIFLSIEINTLGIRLIRTLK